MSSASNFPEFLREHRERYLLSLPGRIDRIRALWVSTRGAGDTQGLRELVREVHSIAGSGGTFGLPAVSESARALELAVPGGDDAAILAAMDALEASIRDAGR